MNTNVFVVADYQNGKLALFKKDQRIEAIQYCPSEKAIQVGDIYVAKTVSVVKNLNAAFVELIPGIRAFLPMEQFDSRAILNRKEAGLVLHEGDEVLVQVEREAVKSKDAVVTTMLAIVGEYVLLSRFQPRIGYSSQFTKQLKEAWKQKLLQQEGTLFTMDPKGSLTVDLPYGMVFRSALADDFYAAQGNDARAQELVSTMLTELCEIRETLDSILAHADKRTCYSCMYKSAPDFMRFFSQITKKRSVQIDRYVTDSREVYEHLQDAFTVDQNSLELYNDPDYPLYKLYSLESTLEELLGKRVWLKSGGNLIIEPTEALTVIDVNTAKNVDRKAKEDVILNLNLEATAEIARQLRLRNLSGIIIVDFINMKKPQHNDQLLSELKRLLREDPVFADVVDLTPLGLVEITRKKVDKSLKESLDNK